MHPELRAETIDLRRIVRVNESIKEVLQISAASYLVAINSMIIAKSVGEQLSGFGVVSTELRVFSHKLDEAMEKLEMLTFGLVRMAALYKKLGKERRYLLDTMAKNQQAQGLLAPVLLRKEEQIQKLEASFADDKSRLASFLSRAIQLCKSGQALAKCAKIEAAYGGELSTVLNQIAEKIEVTVQQILMTLKVLETAIEG